MYYIFWAGRKTLVHRAAGRFLAFSINGDEYGREIHAIHVGPLIRRESIYENELVEDRKHLFNLLYNFVRRIDIQYMSCSVKKSECDDEVEMTSKLTKAMARKLRDNEAFFHKFDRIIVYYDNGQVQLTKIITSLFNALLSSVHTGIPVRTLEDWETGRRTPPEYIPRLIEYQLKYEKLTNKK